MNRILDGLKDFGRRYGLVAEQEDKKVVFTQRGYGAIGGSAIMIILFGFFVFSSNEITDPSQMPDGKKGFRLVRVNTKDPNNFLKIYIQENHQRENINGRQVVTFYVYNNRFPAQVARCLGGDNQPKPCSRSTQTKLQYDCELRNFQVIANIDYTGYHLTGSRSARDTYGIADNAGRLENIRVNSGRIHPITPGDRYFPIVCRS